MQHTNVYRVDENCELALKQACQHASWLYVWIDAICMNKTKLTRNSVQVNMVSTMCA